MDHNQRKASAFTDLIGEANKSDMNNDTQAIKQTPSIVVTGVIGILMVLLIAATLIKSFTVILGTTIYLDWVGTFFMFATPFQIMMAIVWGNAFPEQLGNMRQPLKGLALLLMFLLAGTLCAFVLLYTVGQGVMTPILIHYVIQSVAVSLFVIIAFGCWPVSKLTGNKLFLGVGTLVYCYLLDFVIFKIFYNYSFFEGLPFYTVALDPGGLINGITALTFAVTAVSLLMVLTLFNMWPITRFIKPDNQPVFGLAVTSVVLLATALVYSLFVTLMGIDPMVFMVRGPVCIIFGSFLVSNMMQFQLFVATEQPWRGLALTAFCLLGAAIMYQLYQMAIPLFTGNELPAGHEGAYLQEIWIATAMLGITFPVINFVSGAFDFWPVKRKEFI